MEILQKSKELSAQELYHLTMNPTTRNVKDNDTQEIEVEAWAIYKDVNSKGEEQTILAIMTPEKEVIATNSKTFREDFLKMQELFEQMGEQVHTIKIVSGQSKNERTFYTCVYVN